MARGTTLCLLVGYSPRTVRILSPPSFRRHGECEYAVFHAFSASTHTHHRTEDVSQHLQRPDNLVTSLDVNSGSNI